MTITDVIAYYLENLRCKRPESVERQIRHIERLCGDLPASEFRGQHFDEYRQKRRLEGVTDSTVNREGGYLRAAFRVCHRAELVDRVPHLRMVREPAGPQDWMTEDQMLRVAEILDRADPLGDFARMAFYVGWRKNALTALTWPDVDWERRILTLPARLSKAGKFAQFPIEGKVEEILRRRHEARTLDDVEIPWIFHRNGARVRQFDSRWHSALKAAGLPRMRFHCLRASCVIFFVDAGVDQLTIQRLVQMTPPTFARYHRIRPEAMRGAVLQACGG